MHTALFKKQKINKDGISSCLLTINNSSLVCQGRSEATSQKSARKGWCGGRKSTTCVWNLPRDVEYRSTNAFGWPRIIITVLQIRADADALTNYWQRLHDCATNLFNRLPDAPTQAHRSMRSRSTRAPMRCARCAPPRRSGPPFCTRRCWCR